MTRAHSGARRPAQTRVQIRLSPAERQELESAARRAGYQRLGPFVVALARGEALARDASDRAGVELEQRVSVQIHSALEPVNEKLSKLAEAYRVIAARMAK